MAWFDKEEEERERKEKKKKKEGEGKLVKGKTQPRTGRTRLVS
jgi:hypothetical protein